MTTPRNLFIKIPPDWSFAFIGGVREFVPIDTLVISKLYATACHYVVLRHNFICGHIDNNRYNTLINQLIEPYTTYGMAVSSIKYYVETLYRQCRPILDVHPGMLRNALFWNDDGGDVVGVVFEYIQPYPVTTLRFA